MSTDNLEDIRRQFEAARNAADWDLAARLSQQIIDAELSSSAEAAVYTTSGFSSLPAWAVRTLSSLGGIKSERPAKELYGKWPVLLYHVTFSEYVPDIMRKGLIGPLAREKSVLQAMLDKEVIEGVYFAEDWRGLLQTMGPAWLLGLSPGEEIVVLKVDIPEYWMLIPDPDLAGYDDTTGRLYVPGSISLRPIPPSMISVYRRFTEEEVIEITEE